MTSRKSSSRYVCLAASGCLKRSFHEPVMPCTLSVRQAMPVVQIAYGTVYLAPASYHGLWKAELTCDQFGSFAWSSGARKFALTSWAAVCASGNATSYFTPARSFASMFSMFVKFDSWTLTLYSFSKPRISFWSMYCAQLK